MEAKPWFLESRGGLKDQGPMLIYEFCALLLFTGQLLGGAHTENVVGFGESVWEHPLATGHLSPQAGR